MKKCVILLHGMFRTAHDMHYLEKGLQELGYQTLSPTLPATFGSLKNCTLKLEHFLAGKLEGYEKIYFVAHSMGGLVTRSYLARNTLPHLERCVLIGVPNHGVSLTSTVNWNPFFGAVIRILPSLVPPGPTIGKPMNTPPPEIGLIGGTVNKDIAFGFLFGYPSDGRVPVDSIPLDEAKETVWLPLNHHKIHWSPECLDLVNRFLTSGSFTL